MHRVLGQLVQVTHAVAELRRPCDCRAPLRHRVSAAEKVALVGELRIILDDTGASEFVHTGFLVEKGYSC